MNVKLSSISCKYTVTIQACVGPSYAINSVALSLLANYTDWATTTCQRNLVPTFVDRGVSCGQHGGSPTFVNLSFLDRSKLSYKQILFSSRKYFTIELCNIAL
jgi:hypothetical protein